MHVKPLEHQPGTDWIPERAREIQRDTPGDVLVVIDPKGPASDLVSDLRAADVELHVADTDDVCDSFAEFFKAVRARGLRHGNYPELNSAASSAVPREVGERKAWGRKKSDSDISTLEGVTLAAWWAANHQPSDEPLVAWV